MADEQEEVFSPDVHFEPIVKLPLVEIMTMEESEETLFQMRAKLFRYDSENSEWKERGTGELKILQHKENGTIRILMRRDKTLKICANHHLLPYLELTPHSTSKKAWMWKTPADFADEKPTSELLAVRFGSEENARKFKTAFDEAKTLVLKQRLEKNEEEEEDNKSDSNGESAEESDNDEDQEVVKKDASEKEEAEAETLTTKLEELSVKEDEKSETSSPKADVS